MIQHRTFTGTGIIASMRRGLLQELLAPLAQRGVDVPPRPRAGRHVVLPCPAYRGTSLTRKRPPP